jgi:hypothetical protein
MSKATLYDFRDMDLLLRLAREGDNEGWADTHWMAEAVGLSLENGGPRAMGMRLAWMRKYGMVDYSPDLKMWRLSPSGVRVTNAHLKAAQERAIKAVPDEALVDVMSHVTSRYMLGDPVIAHLLRREFLFGTKPR